MRENAVIAYWTARSNGKSISAFQKLKRPHLTRMQNGRDPEMNHPVFGEAMFNNATAI
jgi:hypothetical protein